MSVLSVNIAFNKEMTVFKIVILEGKLSILWLEISFCGIALAAT